MVHRKWIQPGESPNGHIPLMHLEPGERFYKFYILTEPGSTADRRVEHRIISKEHSDGTLEMVTYNAWHTDQHTEKRDLLRVPSLTKDLFEQVVRRVCTQSTLPPEAVQEIDLSRYATVDEQLQALAGLEI